MCKMSDADADDAVVCACACVRVKVTCKSHVYRYPRSVDAPRVIASVKDNTRTLEYCSISYFILPKSGFTLYVNLSRSHFSRANSTWPYSKGFLGNFLRDFIDDFQGDFPDDFLEYFLNLQLDWLM